LAQNGFRSDINGLRAWAVVAVVLYHFFIPGFGGGFVGVDVFFVISGFLMAGIVVGKLQCGQFNLADFYLARARRILPALLVMVATVLLAGWWLLTPSDYQVLGRHARESVLFTANVQYLSESGYFDAVSHEKWLLHTWSLAVEWQFYFLYPLGLSLLHRLGAGWRGLLTVHVAALMFSLGLCIWWTLSQPDRAFYLLIPRAWELLVGGCVFLVAQRWSPSALLARTLELAGLSAIALSVVLLDADSAWPGAWALAPTFGTAAVLLARRETSWTGSRLAQWLGARSYSIYLWHWPLVAGVVYFDRQQLWWWVAAGLLLSLLLGGLSYRLVEVPSRRWLTTRLRWVELGWLLLGLLVVALSAQAVRRSGFPERLPDALADIESQRHDKNPRQNECLRAGAQCAYGGGQVRAFVVGDSHADAIVTAVAAALPRAEDGLYFRGESACLFVEGARWAGRERREDCERLLFEVRQELAEADPELPLILINRTSNYLFPQARRGAAGQAMPSIFFSERRSGSDPLFLAEFRQHYLDTVCKLARQRPVYLLRPVPEMPVHVPKAVGRATMRGLASDVSLSREQYHERHAFIWAVQDEAASQCGVHVLDPLPYLCDGRFCYGSVEGVSRYVDADHLSERGNRLLTPLFAPIFSRAREVDL
jgi:peptidoglycan/LPS O-acetylase OafA/YrhL/cob(I)alamin adenosyltransferase|tara:strand:- start:6955 stop:8910 length:1956 start_codon:yes stop_codon:yes gene_type:complete